MAKINEKRFIGIVHRRKKTAEGEARPTMVCIRYRENTAIYELKSETNELDFLLGRLAIKWQKVDGSQGVVWQSEKNPEGVLPHQCKTRRVKKEDDLTGIHESLVLDTAVGKQIVTQVPIEFEGLSEGDVAGMILGGSGDRFAAGLSRRGETVGATVWRIPPFMFKDKRSGNDKSQDHELLAELIERQRILFYLVRLRDRDGIRIKETFSLRMRAMKDRIGCGQRIGQSFVGRIFLTEEGCYPEGILEVMAEEEIASDPVYMSLQSEEKRRNATLKKAVHLSPVWDLFDDIEGVGERLAAGLISAIADIRRFWVEPDEEVIQRSRERGQSLEKEAGVAEVLLEEEVGDKSRYEQLLLAEARLRERGLLDRARLTREAIECHKERARTRRKARNKGMSKLKAFCGVHVRFGGKWGDMPKNRQFPRRRRGEVFNVTQMARQSLYLLGDQFNYRPDSRWGQVLLTYKDRFRQKYPEVVEENGRKQYTDKHIHKMALWRTLTKFTEWLFKEWTRIELEQLRAEEGE